MTQENLTTQNQFSTATGDGLTSKEIKALERQAAIEAYLAKGGTIKSIPYNDPNASQDQKFLSLESLEEKITKESVPLRTNDFSPETVREILITNNTLGYGAFLQALIGDTVPNNPDDFFKAVFTDEVKEVQRKIKQALVKSGYNTDCTTYKKELDILAENFENDLKAKFPIISQQATQKANLDGTRYTTDRDDTYKVNFDFCSLVPLSDDVFRSIVEDVEEKFAVKTYSASLTSPPENNEI